MTIKTVHLSPYVAVQGDESEVAKYGRRNVPKMIGQVDKLHHLIAAEGSHAIQDAWGDVEEHIDYAYRADFSKVPTIVFETQNPSLLTKKRAARRFAYLVIGLLLAVILAAWTYATPAHAIPGSTQNPDGSWTGPNGEDLGGGDPNYNPDPEPQQSHEGDPVGILRCGCGYVVVLRKGVSVEAAREACEAAVPAEKECAK